MAVGLDRRGALAAAAGAAALLAARPARAAPAPARKFTFVLVHGAWHGGWCWRDVRAILERDGHRVVTPTLTGMGERFHLGSRATNVSTHIDDINAVIAAEELAGVVLVGHSYGGLPITYVDHPAVRARVYLDGLLPTPGAAMFEGLPADARAGIDATLVDGFRLPSFPPAAFDVPPGNAAATAWLGRRLTSMPIGCFTERARPYPGRFTTTRKIYVTCTANTLDAPKAGVARARAEGWDVRPLDAGHDAMVTEPARTAAILLRIAADG